MYCRVGVRIYDLPQRATRIVQTLALLHSLIHIVYMYYMYIYVKGAFASLNSLFYNVQRLVTAGKMGRVLHRESAEDHETLPGIAGERLAEYIERRYCIYLYRYKYCIYTCIVYIKEVSVFMCVYIYTHNDD